MMCCCSSFFIGCVMNIFEDLIEENDSEIIVFSPGATSFGMFANEFDRGNQFMNAVKEIF